MLARQEAAVRDLIGLPGGHAVAGLIALGHPRRTITKLRRKPVEEFATFDCFDRPPLMAPS